MAKLLHAEPANSFGAHHIRVHFLAARLEIASGNADSAFAHLHEADRYGIPPLTDFYRNRHWRQAQAYRLAGHLVESAAEYRKLLHVWGGFSSGHYELGKLEEERRRPREAQAEYETCLRLWSKADQGMPELEEVRQRLGRLRRPH